MPGGQPEPDRFAVDLGAEPETPLWLLLPARDIARWQLRCDRASEQAQRQFARPLVVARGLGVAHDLCWPGGIYRRDVLIGLSTIHRLERAPHRFDMLNRITGRSCDARPLHREKKRGGDAELRGHDEPDDQQHVATEQRVRQPAPALHAAPSPTKT
jgi:hypothetical protein